MANYNQAQPPRDEYATKLYEQYGLIPQSTMEEIEPIATKLLENIMTAKNGAELVMAREISFEPTLLEVYENQRMSPEEKFGCLLMARSFDMVQTEWEKNK